MKLGSSSEHCAGEEVSAEQVLSVAATVGPGQGPAACTSLELSPSSCLRLLSTDITGVQCVAGINRLSKDVSREHLVTKFYPQSLCEGRPKAVLQAGS